MECPRCGTPSLGNFCPSCGTPLSVGPAPASCQRCGTPYQGVYCPRCGYPAGWPAPPPAPTRGAGLGAVLSFIWLTAIVLFLATLLINLAVLVYAVTVVVPGILSGTGGGVVLFLFPIQGFFLVVTDTAFFFAYFMAILAILVAAFAIRAVRDGLPLLRSMFLPITDIRGRLRSRSAWVTLAQLFMATVFLDLVVLLAFIAAGVPVGSGISGNVDPWLIFYRLLEASVYEEFVFRFLLLGVPLFLAAVLFRSGTPGAGRPGFGATARYLIGGNVSRKTARPLLGVALFLAIASSGVFGLAHLPAWGAWKVITAGSFGLAAAYIFLRHGLAASMILHFTTNYFAAVPLGGFDNLGLVLLTDVLFLSFVVLGSGFLAYYVLYSVGLLRFLTGRPAPSRSRAVPGAAGPAAGARPPPVVLPREYTFPSPPPGYGHAPVRFQCASCGWPEARYVDGRFHCKRCGRPA